MALLRGLSNLSCISLRLIVEIGPDTSYPRISMYKYPLFLTLRGQLLLAINPFLVFKYLIAFNTPLAQVLHIATIIYLMVVP